MTRKGSGRAYVRFSTVTWRSLIPSSRALCALGLLRLISSARTMLANRGPGENVKFRLSASQMWAPRRMCPPARKEEIASSTASRFPRRTDSTLSRSRWIADLASAKSMSFIIAERNFVLWGFFGMEVEGIPAHSPEGRGHAEDSRPQRQAAGGVGGGGPLSSGLSGGLGADAKRGPWGGRGRRAEAGGRGA